MTIIKQVWAYFQALRYRRTLIFSDRRIFDNALRPPADKGLVVAYPDAAFMFTIVDVERAKTCVKSNVIADEIAAGHLTKETEDD